MASSLKKNDGKTCSTCGFENQVDAVKCAQCATTFGPLTTISAPAVSAMDVLKPLTQPMALSVNEVMFVVAGMVDPVTVTLTGEKRYLVVGRGVGGEDLPHLDLAGVSDTSTSVSRRHALLDFHDARPTITDLSSTNSTWVNENKLLPNQPSLFKNGDLLRLGKQFVFAYFSTGQNVTEIISLSKKAAKNEHLTPDLLVDQIGNYLQTLASIQQTLSQIQDHPTVPVTINEMDVRQAPKFTKLRIQGASDAIRLMMYVVGPWRDKHQDDLRSAANTEGDKLSTELSQLTQTKLATMAPDLAEAERTKYVEQLLPHMRTLALHTLGLNTEKKW